MHYYKRNLGDYAKKAGRLSMLQHGAYTLLIDACYDRESFPTESEAIEWTWASTPDEELAVRFVLSRFFKLQDDGTYLQPRIYEELQVYKIGEIQNRLIALSREAKKQDRKSFAEACDQLRAEIKHAPLRKTHEAWTELVEALLKKHEAPPNQEPLTTNHKPLTNTKHKPSEKSEGASDDEKKSEQEVDPPKTPKASKYKFLPQHHQVAVVMSNPINQRFPTQKINLEEWADAVRKLQDIDGYTANQITYLWAWIHSHQGANGFSWADNCRSPMKLRQRKDGLTYFEIIKTQMLRETTHATRQPNASQSLAERTYEQADKIRAQCDAEEADFRTVDPHDPTVPLEVGKI